MSTTLVVCGVTIGLLLLIAIAVTQQTLERNAKEKRRLESALNARGKIIKAMIDCFNEGMLSTELHTLLYSKHRGVYAELSSIAPRNKDYASELAKASLRLSEFKNKPATTGTIRNTDKKQLHDIETMLSGLHNLINKLAERSKINAEQYEVYTQHLRRLFIQTANNALIKPTQHAIDQGKPRLAIHYLQAAKLKMTQEDDIFYSKAIKELDQRIVQLEAEAVQQEAEQAEGDTSAADSTAAHGTSNTLPPKSAGNSH
jgi:hypothetical protein